MRGTSTSALAIIHQRLAGGTSVRRIPLKEAYLYSKSWYYTLGRSKRSVSVIRSLMAYRQVKVSESPLLLPVFTTQISQILSLIDTATPLFFDLNRSSLRDQKIE
ncbi:MAG: hypothetical protein KatS3mg056_0371 [Chloroflexus sp.]|jgi:hypothetical protein|nr:MAG: hypothetical protein KatS3mg045_2036 [Bellilinea sp.]GIV91662.1 MAG: hypothetical protein KatS3mg056_0371 [Chloroflexus sp.]